ncbi:tetratricopeptide repeat (TPR)-like superfamily protein isoform X2 [Tasmannia lanceolata]
MRSTFGSNDCRLLCINSAQSRVVERDNNPWASYETDASLSRDIGSFLDINDLNEMKDLMLDLSSKHIIPHIEQKIRILNQQVSATRRGFKNQIKNLWWRKGKEDASDASNGPMYTFSSIESQIRALGDYAFMLRDYELALSNFRLLSTDYKLDKAWKQYAGVQEMIGLASFMLDQSRKDAEYCMENAFNTYLKIGTTGQRNATRCGLWWAEMLKTWGHYKEAAGVYSRVSNEEPRLHAAVMLEQSSYCYLYSNPPMLRKYGFHLVQAGNRYDISGQRKHAIRTYRNALSVYKGNSWSYINDHVHFNIGKWYALLGIFDVAIKHMLEVLACTHQSLTTQELFLRDFLHIVQSMGKTYEVFKLQLPVINMHSLKVIFEDHRTYASDTAAHVKENLWQVLEEEMVPSLSAIRNNWLESHAQSSVLKKYKHVCVCVAGEAIKVELEFRNPLQTSLSVSGVSLVCELSARSEATGSELGDQYVNDADERRSATGFPDDMALREFIRNKVLDDGISSFVLSEVDFSLHGGETMVVQLNVTPKVEGFLNIVGVRWTLSGSVVGYQNFDSDLSKKKHIKGRRKVTHSSSQNLKFVVIKNLPKLEGYIHQLPRKTYTGNLRRLVLELRNQSLSSVKNLKMKISHPRFLIPGGPKDMDMEFPACLEKQMDSEDSDIQTTFMKSKGCLFSFPKDATIQGGTTFLWPLWLHTGVAGGISMNISIYYEMENFSTDMNYRTLRMHYDLEVLPSLDVLVQITPCPSRLQEYLVHMDIINRAGSGSFWLRQLSSVGYQWKISLLPPYVAICPSQLLLAGQALSCFFKLKDCGKSSTTKDIVTSLSAPLRRDVRLGTQGNQEPLFDISRSPLAEFHYYERMQQEKTVQDCQSTVDFVLISQPEENNANLEPRGLSDPPLLFSHHVCACSIASTSPIWWLVDGPRTVHHDFSASFCETRLYMTIYNCSNAVASIKINTFDTLPNTAQLTDASISSGNKEGWHDVSLADDIKVLSDVQVGVRPSKPSLDSISPFVWCASSSTRVVLEPLSTAKIPLQICIFSPGTYDLSNYALHWNLQFSDNEESSRDATRQSSGTNPGHPFYLTVLQSP